MKGNILSTILIKASFLRIFILVVILVTMHCIISVAQRTLPTTDQFEYAAGPLQSVSTDWIRVSGTGNDLVVADGNNMYNGYLRAMGRKATMANGANDDVKLSFTGQSSFGTTIYCAFVLDVQNVTGLSSTGVYCFILGFGVTNFAARTYIRSSASGYQLGISKTVTPPSVWSDVLVPGTSHLVVIGYTILPGNSSDIASLWIDPMITTVAPPADFTATYGVDFGSAALLDSFFLRQAPGSPNASVDDVSISTAWSDLFRNPVYSGSGTLGPGTYKDLVVTGNSTVVTLSGNILIEEMMSLSDGIIDPAGNTVTYGSNGVLQYSGTLPRATANGEFPAVNGPKELIIENTSGVILTLDRTLAGDLSIRKDGKFTVDPAKSLTVEGNISIAGE